MLDPSFRWGDIWRVMKSSLPKVAGSYEFDVPLAPMTWFRVGGKADVVFKPQDKHDLAQFLKNLPSDIPVSVMGAFSNVIIRDGGLRGVLVKLPKSFSEIKIEGDAVIAGAAAMDVMAARETAEAALDGFAFLVGIPGTIGGAVYMNAGAYGAEIKDILENVEIVTRDGVLKTISNEACGFAYRHSELPEGAIIISASFKGKKGDKAAIVAAMEKIKQERLETQPVKSRTGGSTFANPAEARAWELVDKAGCRGLTLGGAQISEKHCNFMINTGSATAADLEALGEEVRKKVFQNSGISLKWEIRRIGDLS
ncbi:MAG: UDP-N-acetylmuramate dehydrogenase [Alphaproteobacteria bacterium]|nr:UDP-N-acetylmuramate dehydrogenase [Alphaproteobacteria bacterium]